MYVDASLTARMLVASFSHSGAAKRWKRARSAAAAAAAAATQLSVSGAAASLRAVERESLDAEEPRRRIKDERGEFSLPNPWALFFCLGMEHLDKDLLAWARVGRYRAGYAGAKVLGYVG